jgi:hypothetical protein
VSPRSSFGQADRRYFRSAGGRLAVPFDERAHGARVQFGVCRLQFDRGVHGLDGLHPHRVGPRGHERRVRDRQVRLARSVQLDQSRKPPFANRLRILCDERTCRDRESEKRQSGERAKLRHRLIASPDGAGTTLNSLSFPRHLFPSA